ncbi:MAG: hypothetical protein AAGJ28_25240, partial [Pseudomonadota bacterium]
MAIAEVELPDGRIAEIEVPDGMTMEAAQTQLQAMYSAGDLDLAPEVEGPAEAVGGLQGFLSAADDLIPDPLAQFAGSANRAALGAVDFLTTEPINNIAGLAGFGPVVPTLTETLDETAGTNYMEPGMAREAVDTAGELLTAAGGLRSVPRAADTMGAMLADFVGAGSSMVTAPFQQAAPYLDDFVRNMTTQNPMTAGRRAAVEPDLLARTGESDTFGFDLRPRTPTIEDPRPVEVFRDRSQNFARTQGMREGVVTMVRDATPQGREKMRRMLDIVRRGMTNEEYRALNSPGDIVGESITNRTRAILDANRSSGRRVNAAARALEGEAIDVQPAMQAFQDDLADMGVSLRTDDGQISLSFFDSDIEDVPGPVNAITKLVKSMARDRNVDAQAVHRLKRRIDEVVTYGKRAEGLSGAGERVLKNLRRNLDSILDTNFPAYNAANEDFRMTRSALDALQEAAGQRIDLTGVGAEAQLGTLSRRVLGNAVSRQQLLNGLAEVDRVAKEVISNPRTEVAQFDGVLSSRPFNAVTAEDLDDDLIKQIQFVSNLEEVFGTNRANSFLGDITKAGDRVTDGAVTGTGTVTAAREGLRFVRDRVRG